LYLEREILFGEANRGFRKEAIAVSQQTCFALPYYIGL
jgi:hypothetical protein